jgi:glycosyltransferase involved in cell wall biosynthesis
MRLDGAGVVISSTTAFAHHVRPPDDAIHIAYCHSPPHFLWGSEDYFRGRAVMGRLLWPALEILRRTDRAAAHRVDVYLANSRYTADRIRQVYGREAAVVYPPIDTGALAPDPERSGRFLVVSRFRRHKRIDLAIEAATANGWPLDIIGQGPDEPSLRRAAGPTVRFLGRLSDEAVRAAMARCVALIVPGTEDFGMTMAEVQAAGRPPVAFARGGALEIVRDGETGFLFDEPTSGSVAEAMRRAMATDLDTDALVRSARRFDRTVFDAELLAVVARVSGPSGSIAP